MKQASMLMICGLLIVLLFGCKKQKENLQSQHYYLSAKLDGKLTDFSYGASFGSMGKDGRISVIDLAGNCAATVPSSHLEDQPPSLEIDMWTTDGDIQAGTYTGASPVYTPRCQYIVQSKNETLIHVSGNDFIFNILEISKEKGIRGTFSGKLNLDGHIIELTEGALNLPYDTPLSNN